MRISLATGIGETDWVFRCIFKTPEDLAAGQSLDLLVEKLDTFATIWLNDKQIHSSQNGFMSYRIRLAEHARKQKGDGNVLMFHFASAFREGRKLEYVQGYLS
jgi:beta-mannosidase